MPVNATQTIQNKFTKLLKRLPCLTVLIAKGITLMECPRQSPVVRISVMDVRTGIPYLVSSFLSKTAQG
jgi:hypothetical protein